MEENKFSLYEGDFLHISLINAKFAKQSIIIEKNLPFKKWRIERAMKKLIKLEELYNKYFVKSRN